MRGSGCKLCLFVMGLVAGIGIGLAARGILHVLRENGETVLPETVTTVVDYPFAGAKENWSLVLCELNEDSMRCGREFQLYDAGGKLVQVLPCEIDDKELMFRFDRLFHYYGYGEDLVVFPADAADTGAKGLCYPWEDDDEIKLCRYTENGMEYPVYEDREALLAAYGFEGQKPFYEYYDQFDNCVLTLYFDAGKGQGCGVFYDYGYNYDLEKVTRCWGFCFDGVVRGQWDEDTYSVLSYDGRDARRSNVSGYQQKYAYTDDGKLSSYEARGTVVDYGEGGPWEDTLLSMEYIYRDDNTLYFKHYRHHHILFGTSYCGQSGYYDRRGRLACRYAYVTHGSYYFFYIYENDSEKPAYCLWLDMNFGYANPVMTVYS